MKLLYLYSNCDLMNGYKYLDWHEKFICRAFLVTYSSKVFLITYAV